MIIVKVGGGAGIDYDALCADIAGLWAAGLRMALLHGGSHETNLLAERLGHPPRFVLSPSGYSSRYTDIGLSGLDGRLLEGRRKAVIRIVEDGKQKVLRDDWTGTVERVNSGLIVALLDDGYLPVIAPLASSFDGEAINVDGDRAAAAVAAALGAEALLLLSNVPGLLRAFPDESTLIPRIERAAVEEFLPIAQGRMKKKVLGAAEALAGGVGRVVLGDARSAQPVSRALAGEGTVIE